MTKRALIVGVTGQDGAYLAKLLLQNGYEVQGGSRHSREPVLQALDIASDVVQHEVDLGDTAGIQRLLDKVAPDEIYNLASQSLVSASFEQPLNTAETGALGAMRILEGLRQSGGRSRFYQASTSEMFGKARLSPQDESTAFQPRSPYGIAKLFAHWTTVNYREAFGLFACSGILFNHESPLRPEAFVTRKITLGFARIRHGLQDVVRLGNLDARRDWGFAGDYVEGMWRMLQREAPDDFVLATGVTHSIRDLAEFAADAFGWSMAWRGDGLAEEGIDRKSGRRLICVDPAFYRPSESTILVGNPAKAATQLSWRPQLQFPELVRLMAEADDRRIARGEASVP